MEESEELILKKQSNLFIPNENIYKTNILDENGEVSHVFVFCAGLRSHEHMSEIFSEIEITYYKENDVHVVFSEQLINKDDSVRDIKHKIVNELLELNKKNKQYSLSIEELYLFTLDQKYLDMEYLYQEITENDTKKLTKERFFQYATNISADPYVLDNGEKEKGGLFNDIFSYDQWMQLSKSGPKNVFIPVGMEFQDHYDFMFPSNPYKNQLWSEQIRYNISNKNNLLTFDKSVLLNYGNSKNLMVCLAKNVFSYGEKMNTEIEYICELYFPFLFKHGVSDSKSFEEISSKLANESKERNNKKTKRRFEVTQLYREIYWSRDKNDDLPYLERGIKNFFITILSNNSIQNLPLEYLFRNIHSNEKIPFIKFNPGSRKENMYRLFSDNISLDGKKIPLLDESVIMKLSRETGKKKQISLFVQDKMNVFVHINSNSEIKVEGTLNNLLSSDELNNQLVEILHPIFNDLNNILQSLGYNIRNFENLHSDNIIFSEYSYQFILPLSVKMNLQNQLDYITPIFDVLSTDVSKGAKMRFKRVRNYKEMDAKSIIIREIYDRTGSSESVIQGLMDNYDMSEEEAIITYSEFRSQYQLLKQKIIESPGFETTFQMKPLKNELVVEISDISSTSYISALNTYIDVILRLSQKPKTISILPSKLKKFKTKVRESKKTEKEEELETVIAVKDNTTELYKPVEEKEDEEANQEDGIFFDEDIDYYQDYDEENGPENDEIEEDEDDEFYGGDDTPEEFKANIDGMPIKNPSPFFRRMMELDPTLFVTEESSKFPLYSKACPSGDKRQPVIITDEEKKRIDETNPGSYGHALLHGSSEENKHWYICPRFWCLKTNSSISEEDVKAGKCGNIIPRGVDRVPPGAYVYEFNNPKNHMKDGKYVQHVPGFLKKDKHPDGLCVPCCFGKAWDSKDQVRRREDCDYSEDGEKIEKKERKTKKRKVSEIQNIQTNKTLSYIISSVSYPIPQNRWGFLPLAVQLFFKTDTSLSVDPKNAALIKSGEKCLLRKGVEKSENQSFMSCFAYFYAYKHKLDVIPTIEQMRTIFTDNINLDIFIKYHNGNLVSIFRPKKAYLISSNIEIYSNTDFYKTINLSDETQREYLEDTISSYENFLKFIQDEESFIDHTYLWDFFCDRNNDLMKDGVNLIILQLSDDDITERVQLVCPSNAYSSIEYDVRKETVILLKQSHFYEPIHLYEQNDVIVISKTNEPVYVLQRGDYLSNNYVFNVNNEEVYKLKQGETRSNTTVFKKTFLENTVLNEVKEILNLIKITRKKYCHPLPSMPKKYNFKRNLQLLEIVRILKLHHYQIEGQVLNYRNKVIGVRVKKHDDQSLLFVPCFPSPIIKDLKTNYMDEIELWLDYEQTRNRLTVISNETDRKIFSRPVVQVMEDGLVVGLLTETNQFVQVNPPVTPNDNDKLPIVKHDSYSYVQDGKYESAEKVLTTEKENSSERIQVIRNIHLETQFYNIFRTILRIQLNNYENRDSRKRILYVIDDPYSSYRSKLQQVKDLLSSLLKDHVSFKEMTKKNLDNVENIVMCNSGTNCKSDKPEYCLVTEDGKCMSLFPAKNLVTQSNNENMYFERLSDELIRYNRTKLFMFHPKTYMNISNVDFQIQDDELFLLESKLTREYFRDLTPYGSNNYVNYIAYDNAQPDDYNKNIQNYSNKISLEEQSKLLNKTEEEKTEKMSLQDFIIDCIEHTKPNVTGGNQPGSWRMKFPNNAKELFFNKTVHCSYIPIIYIFQQVYVTTISIKNIKTALWKGYKEIFEKLDAKDKVFSILKKQGKVNLINLAKQSSFEIVLMSDDYYITDLDWWVFSTTARLPVILFSSTTLKSMLQPINWLKLGGRNIKGEKYYFVRSPSDNKTNVPLSYHVVDNGYAFSEMKDDMFVQAERGDSKYSLNMQTLQEFISRFRVITKLKK